MRAIMAQDKELQEYEQQIKAELLEGLEEEIEARHEHEIEQLKAENSEKIREIERDNEAQILKIQEKHEKELKSELDKSFKETEKVKKSVDSQKGASNPVQEL